MRIEQVTFTRFLAAISIVVYHYGTKLSPFNKSYFSFLFEQANVGVSYFFILSGFVMVFAYGKKNDIDVAGYFKNRFARIYPVYLLAIVLILIHYLLNQQEIDVSGLVLNTLVIQAWVPAKAISFNSPGWSLTVEFFFYAIFPFLLKYIYTKDNYKKAIIPVILIWLATQAGFNWALHNGFDQGEGTASHNFLKYFPLMHLNEFLVGNIAGKYFLSMDKKMYRNYDGLLVLLALAFFLILRFPAGINYHDGFLALIFVPIIFFLSLNTGRLTALFNRPFMVFLGEISYGIYILQYPVFTWARSLLKRLHIVDPHAIFYISTILLIVVSGISYRYFETPVRNRIKNWRVRKGIPNSGFRIPN